MPNRFEIAEQLLMAGYGTNPHMFCENLPFFLVSNFGLPKNLHAKNTDFLQEAKYTLGQIRAALKDIDIANGYNEDQEASHHSHLALQILTILSRPYLSTISSILEQRLTVDSVSSVVPSMASVPERSR